MQGGLRCNFWSVWRVSNLALVVAADSDNDSFCVHKVSETVLDGEQLQFYKYRGELKELLEGVRARATAAFQLFKSIHSSLAQGWHVLHQPRMQPPGSGIPAYHGPRGQ